MKLCARVEVRQVGATGLFEWAGVEFESQSHRYATRMDDLFRHLGTLGLEPRLVEYIREQKPDFGAHPESQLGDL